MLRVYECWRRFILILRQFSWGNQNCHPSESFLFTTFLLFTILVVRWTHVIWNFLQPWYAHGIAESILRTTNLSVPLKVSSLILKERSFLAALWSLHCPLKRINIHALYIFILNFYYIDKSFTCFTCWLSVFWV